MLMKKLFLLVAAFLMATTFAYAQEWVGVNKGTPTRIQETLVSSSEEEIVVDVKVDGFYRQSVVTDQGKQFVITGDDMALMLVKGAPDLPMYPISMIVGDRAKMDVKVVEAKYTDFENIEIAPSKGNFSRQINPADVEFVYGDMYQQDAFYPSAQAALETPYILRDFRAQNLMVYPYAYNPVTKTLRVYTDLRISVKKISDNGENQKVSHRKSNTIDPEVKAAYKNRFINYSSAAKYDFIDEEGSMLVVCVDEYTEALQELVDWKNISGRPTTMVEVSETGVQNNLKSYLEEYYEANPDFTYLLLVGEYDNLPPMQLNVRSDNGYGMLEGDDYYEEIYVGRLSVNSVEDAENQVKKIIHYERDMEESATWLSRAAGIAADEGTGHNGEADYVHMNYIADTLKHYTYTEVSQHYAYVNSPTAAGIREDINEGTSVANYCNHGSPTSWAVTDFDNDDIALLENDYRLPFVWSVACNNGQFDVGECFGEAWMRATNITTGAPTGAVGGMFSWISQPWIPPMYGQDEMNAILTEWREGYKHTLGGASVNGNQFVLDMSPEDYGSTHNSWILFGDPSMMLRTMAPQNMGVTLSPSVIMVGMSSLTVNADAEFGIATLSKDGEVLATAYVENGIAELNFPAQTTVGTLQLVVLGYNRVTEILDVQVTPAEGAYLAFAEYDLNQEDGQMDYSDYIDLSLTIENVGADPANNVTVELSSDSEYVTIIDNTASIASLDANASIVLDKEFSFTVAANVPDETKITFDLTCSDGENTWESSFKVVANAPVFELKEIYVETENENGTINPGDEIEFFVTMLNAGHSAAVNVVPQIFSSSPDITVGEIEMEETEFPAVGEFTYHATLTIGEDVVNGSVYEMITSASAGYTILSATYLITVGNIVEDFETGDFENYEWELQGAVNWTIDTETVYEGTYSARSGAIGDSQYSQLILEVDVLAAGDISFYVKTSSESYYDALEFRLDNTAVHSFSGEEDWEYYSYPLQEGHHTLEWRYKKDSSWSLGEDCAWIDFITFPPVSMTTSSDPVANLVAEVDGAEVTLTWDALADADEYIVSRDGVQVSAQTETTFTETLEDGIYTYNVIAKIGETYSQPAFVVVNVSTVGVIETEMAEVAVYPNPTSGVLYVELDSVFDATVYNYQGQVVMRNTVDNGQVDMSRLSSGVYFVQIKTNDKVMIEKVVLR